jgi:DNA (cytosine-5)-methyltransferase 1
MGFPDEYTNHPKAKKTNRYQATGNSWAVPVVKWLGERMLTNKKLFSLEKDNIWIQQRVTHLPDGSVFFNFGKDIVTIDDNTQINCTITPENVKIGSMVDIVSADAPSDIYISPVGCYGIVRRKEERHLTINPRLEEVLLSISSEMSAEEIEKRSRIQHRGRFSSPASDSLQITNTVEDTPAPQKEIVFFSTTNIDGTEQLSLFEQ